MADFNASIGGGVGGFPGAPNHSTKGCCVMDRYRLGLTFFLVAALASFLLSIGLWFTDNRDEGVFVGLWVPSVLAAGAFWLSAVGTRA